MRDTDIRGVTVFEEKHMISIMMFLSIGDCKKMDIYENISTNPRIPDKLDRLEALGLLNQTLDEKNKSIMLELTEKGRKVAKDFAEINTIIKSY